MDNIPFLMYTTVCLTLVSWWTFVMFLPFGLWEWYCNEHSHMSVIWILVLNSFKYIPEWNGWISWKFCLTFWGTFDLCFTIAAHSSTFAWKIPWTEEPGRLQSMGSLESDTTEWLPFSFSLSCIGEGNGNPLQCSCLENPRDGGSWWAAIYGVTQSPTWLKQLSSSSTILYSLWQDSRISIFLYSGNVSFWDILQNIMKYKLVRIIVQFG